VGTHRAQLQGRPLLKPERRCEDVLEDGGGHGGCATVKTVAEWISWMSSGISAAHSRKPCVLPKDAGYKVGVKCVRPGALALEHGQAINPK